jgi:hypothetical protein
MAEHTPTPWTYRPARHDDWGWIRGPKPDNDEVAPLVAIARSGEWETFESNDKHRAAGTDPCGANAAFIVKAVNNHDALVAELQRLFELYGHQATADVLSRVGRAFNPSAPGASAPARRPPE